MVNGEHEVIAKSEYIHVLSEININVQANGRDDVYVNESSVTVLHALGYSTDTFASVCCIVGESD